MPPDRNLLPRISIVVPSYNQGHYLRDTFESIFSQDYPHLEVVVMDGGSSDDSVEIIRSYESRLKYWQSQKDGGQSAAINAGVQRCSGDLVTWLNSDDYYWGDALWTVGRAFAQHPEHGLYIGNGFRLDQQTRRLSPFCPRHIALNRTALIQGGDYILQPSTFFLRRAWNEVGALKPDLHYCMDWDLFIRIAGRYSAVLINEFLAVSREYEETKSRGGKLKRAFELVGMIQGHSKEEITPGTLGYIFESLLGVTSGKTHADLKIPMADACVAIGRQLHRRFGWGNCFPEQSDPQDQAYLPLAGDLHLRSFNCAQQPTISVILSCEPEAQARDMAKTVAYASGSSSNVEFIETQTASSPAAAINTALRNARGEVVTVLNARDSLTCDSLREVGRAFAELPQLNVLFGNALFVDKNHRLCPLDDGVHRTAFHYAESATCLNLADYRSPSFRLPQPPVFFRRRLLDQFGYLNESLTFLHDRELIRRFSQAGEARKLDRTLVISRVDDRRWDGQSNPVLAELYRLNRTQWPSIFSAGFGDRFRDFTENYLRRRLERLPGGPAKWIRSLLARLSAWSGIGNPERLLPASRMPPVPLPLEPAQNAAIAKPARRRFHSLWCLRNWPNRECASEYGTRDFHLLRHLLSLSSVEILSLDPATKPDSRDPLVPRLEALHTPETIRLMHKEWVNPQAGRQKLKGRFINWLRRLGLPVAGSRYHLDVMEQVPPFMADCQQALQNWHNMRQLDFLFVSPQNNPAGLFIAAAQPQTRMILVAHELEANRMQRVAESHRGLSRLALKLEARRARRFEADNLARYDGVIVASEEDRQILVSEYHIPNERILVIATGINPSEWEANLSRLNVWLADLASPPISQLMIPSAFTRVGSIGPGSRRLSA